MDGIFHCSWYTGDRYPHGLIIWIETLDTLFLDKPQHNTAKKQKLNQKNQVSVHPFHSSGDIVHEFVTHILQDAEIDISTQDHILFCDFTALLPTVESNPYPSFNLIELAKLKYDIDVEFKNPAITLQKWSITGLLLLPEILSVFFDSLIYYSANNSSTIFIGDDFRFLFAVQSFFERMYNSKSFIPTVYTKENLYYSSVLTIPLISAFDQSLEQEWNFLYQNIPTMWLYTNYSEQSTFLPNKTLVLKDFVDSLVVARLQSILKTKSKFFSKLKDKNKSSANEIKKYVYYWIESLQNVTPIPTEFNSFSSQVLDMTTINPKSFDSILPLDIKMCFKLETPPDASESWKLAYYIQSIEDPSLLVPAHEIWNTKGTTLRYLNKKFDNPQEFLLLSLGRALKIYPAIADSLQEKTPEYCSLTTKQAFRFLNENALLLKSLGFGVIVPGESKSEKQIYRPKVTISITTTSNQFLTSSNLLNFNWQIAIGDDFLTPEEIALLSELKEPLVYLKGKWVELDSTVLRKTIDHWTKLQNTTLTVQDAFKLKLDLKDSKQKLLVPEVAFPEWINKSFIDKQKITSVTIPQTFKGVLRPYQLNGVSWLFFMLKIGLNPCLADDMGLGKTIQIIVIILLLKEQKENELRQETPLPHTKNQVKNQKNSKKSLPSSLLTSGTNLNVLIISPTSVLQNWGKELQKFSPVLTWNLYHGSTRTEDLLKNTEIVLTSYSIVRRDIKAISKKHWDLIIVDEAQNIKNPVSKQALALKSIKANHKIILTGTPIENRLLELWSLFDFLEPQYLGDLNFFKKTFILPIEKFQNSNSLEKLKTLIKPFILRRVKSDKSIIDDLPDKIETKEYCYLTKEQASLYQSILNAQLLTISQSTGIKKRGNMLATLLKLKQVCNHPVNLLSDNSSIEDRSGKLKRLWELIQEILETDEKILIFTQFVEMGMILKKFLQIKLFKEVPFLYGGLSIKQREKIINNFMEQDETYPILIISLKAGGTGLNLTRASHVFHYDRWWNPAVENQATDRSYRIGQLKNVQVHKLITKGTLEERIDELIESKIELAENVIDAGEDWLTSLSTDDFKELLTLSKEEYESGEMYESET